MYGRLGKVWVAGMLACSGCYRTAVTTQTIERQRYERRVPLSASAPIWHASWHEEPDAIVGQLDVQECRTSRAWTSLQMRVTERTPYHSAGWAFVGLASVAAFVGAVAWDSKVNYHCDDYPGGCHSEFPANTLPKFMLGTSLVLGTTGVIMVLEDGGTTSEVLSRKEDSSNVTKSCFTGHDLAELLVVARDESGRVWPVHLASTGEARIPLPQSPDVPRGVELELVVYRAPHSSGGLYRRGLVLETFERP